MIDIAAGAELVKRAVIRRGLPLLILTAFAVWTIAPVWRDPGGYLPVRENMITTVPLFW